MTVEEIMSELEFQGSEQIKKVLKRHGAREPFVGVKIEFLKKIQKKVKKDYILSLQLFDTGNSDAMYLAGLIADETKMTKVDLNNWVQHAYWHMLSDYTLAWVASESKYGRELALEWIDSETELVASAGWATLSSLMSVKVDSELNIDELSKLLDRVEKTIHTSPNRVRHSMNGFIIAAGSFVAALTEKAIQIGNNIGKVSVDMGGTACKVPSAPQYIEKVKNMGKIGKKRSLARC